MFDFYKSLSVPYCNLNLNESDSMETSWLYAILSLFLVLAFRYLTKRRNIPPSPVPALPVIGHLHLLKQPIHRTYLEISKKLGPIFSLHIGNQLLVVVSSSAAVDECFTKNDIVLANRPQLMVGKYIGYNNTSLGTSAYGEHWRHLRKLATIEIFSSTRLNMFQSTRQDEIKLMLQKLYQTSRHDFAKVELRPLLSELSFNILMRMVAGKRYFGEIEDTEEAKQFRKFIPEVFKFNVASNPADFFPILRWIGYKNYEKNLTRLGRKMDAIFQGLIDEYRTSRNTNTMIDHLLHLQKSDPEYYTDTIIKGIISNILLAGTDTSTVTLEWAMSALLNHPEKLEKARAEVEGLVGNDRLINESEVSYLPYLQNVISETLRLFPAAPLLLPHVSSSECKIGGYDIPPGTILIVNAWAIHRDPKIWDDPTSFKPERFENGEVGTTKLMPFGMGRRSCPGSGLAQRVVGLALASLIQCLEWQRINDAEIDLTEGNGLTLPKAMPLEAKCKARHVLHKVLLPTA